MDEATKEADATLMLDGMRSGEICAVLVRPEVGRYDQAKTRESANTAKDSVRSRGYEVLSSTEYEGMQGNQKCWHWLIYVRKP